ncbi:MAG: hypothetical protein ACD_21C00014G0004 [uncultured bacterium]|nr:MAG: hypothetical protein ACD_21C00014G0004 [uncultured bacterium]
MKFKDNFFKNYLKLAPLPLAVERTLECEILSLKKMEQPILDLGCGDGIFASILFDEKIDVGVEPNPKELESAKSFGVYHELIQCYGDNIPKPSGQFKTILSNSVLEHIPKLDAVLQEAHRLLSDEGVMYVTVPTMFFEQYTVIFQLLQKLRLQGLAKQYAKFFNKFWRHYHCYDYHGWQEIMERNGFAIKDSKNYAIKHICIFNDLCAPLSFFAFITKKICNRWFIFKKIRIITAILLYSLFSRLFKTDINASNTGLIFLELVKTSKKKIA